MALSKTSPECPPWDIFITFWFYFVRGLRKTSRRSLAIFILDSESRRRELVNKARFIQQSYLRSDPKDRNIIKFGYPITNVSHRKGVCTDLPSEGPESIIEVLALPGGGLAVVALLRVPTPKRGAHYFHGIKEEKTQWINFVARHHSGRMIGRTTVELLQASTPKVSTGKAWRVLRDGIRKHCI